MVGLVPAAGVGGRLRSHTDGLPKTLLPVDVELTILDVILRSLASAGLGEVAVVVGGPQPPAPSRAPSSRTLPCRLIRCHRGSPSLSKR